jgi:hypothetical protein
LNCAVFNLRINGQHRVVAFYQHRAASCTENGQIKDTQMDTLDVGSQEKPETTKISLVWEIKTEILEDPDKIKNVTIALPSGMTAKFIRSGGWASRS